MNYWNENNPQEMTVTTFVDDTSHVDIQQIKYTNTTLYVLESYLYSMQ